MQSLGCEVKKPSRSSPSVGVDGLAVEDHFARAARDRGAHVGKDLFHRAVVEAPAHVWHDAERAIVRAAALDRYERAEVAEGPGDAVRFAAQPEQGARFARFAEIFEAGPPRGELLA